MSERSRGFVVLLAAAALTGVVLEVQRHRKKDAATSSVQASASAGTGASARSPAGDPELRTLSRAEIERAISRLESLVKGGASDARSPWALAHGLIAFGPELVASDGRKAIDVIGSFAEKGENGYAFAGKKDSQLVEPHRHLLVKTLLEVGVRLERELRAADGKRITLGRLVGDLRKQAKLPQSDAEWHHAAWLLSALSLDERRGAKPGGGLTAAELGRAALERLERDHHVVSAYAGPPDAAFDPGSPLHRAKEDKSGIYGHSCGGLHLVQAVTLAVTQLKSEPELARLKKQLGVLAFRYDVERRAYAKLSAAHPEHGLVLRTQQLKFFGHLIETLMLARAQNAYRPDTEGGKKLDGIIRAAAADVAQVVEELDRGGVGHRLDAIRKDREQTYLDLIGDGCHAIHGLREALALHAGT